MRSEWSQIRLGDISEMKYGKMPQKSNSTSIGFPVYSGYRVVGYCNEYNTQKGTLIVVARGVGGTGDVKLAPDDCYLTNLSISVNLDSSKAIVEYLYYYFSVKNLRYLDSGSAQSQITISDLKNLLIPLPSPAYQAAVVKLLSSLDSKIKLNQKINHNLPLAA